MNIEIVEDNQLIRELVGKFLEKHEYEINQYESSEDFLNGHGYKFCDLLIVDLNLPGESGMFLIKKIRSLGYLYPILMLTVEKRVKVKINAFDAGVDDYLEKPFDLRELLARVRSLLKRNTQLNNSINSRIIRINGFIINKQSRICSSNGGEISLSQREMDLLLYFYYNSGIVLKRADILEDVWGMDVSPTLRTIDNFILKFRKYFESDPSKPKIFLSIRNKGYIYRNP